VRRKATLAQLNAGSCLLGVAHLAERSGVWSAQRTQSWVVRGNQHSGRAKQLSVAEQIAECRYASIIKTAARLVED
jgi:hypothetical protein